MSAYPTLMNELQEKFGANPTKKAAWEVVYHYFEFMDVETCHKELWELTVGLLSNDELNEFTKGRHRLNAIYFFEFTKLFIGAVNVLHNKEKRKTKRKTK